MANGNLENLERQLRVAFVSGLTCTLRRWSETQGGDARTYGQTLTDIWEFCEAVSRQQNYAYPLAADIIALHLFQPEVPRPIRDIVLTAFARWSFEARHTMGETIRGSSVAHIGRIMNPIVEMKAKEFTEWFEDMGTGIPLVDSGPEPLTGYCDWLLAPQSTRMLRGIAFSSSLEMKRMDWFWRLAAESARFPERIFSDPGDFEHRSCFLAPQQLEKLSAFFSQAPETAVRRFAVVYRDRVLTMRRIVYASVMTSGNFAEVAVCDPETTDIIQLFRGLEIKTKYLCAGDIKHRELQVTDGKRQKLLQTVLLGIKGDERRSLVQSIFYEGKSSE